MKAQGGCIRHFGYGSNMLRQRLAQYAKTLDFGFGERVFAPGWELVFNKRKNDGTAAANIERREEKVVFGVLYLLTVDQWSSVKSGEGSGYKQQPIHVMSEGNPVRCTTLVAVKKESGLRPSKDYLEKIVRGAREHGISEDYIACMVAKAGIFPLD